MSIGDRGLIDSQKRRRKFYVNPLPSGQRAAFIEARAGAMQQRAGAEPHGRASGAAVVSPAMTTNQ